MNGRDDTTMDHTPTPDEQRALAALRDLPAPAPSAAARARAKAAFLAGEAPAGERPAATVRHLSSRRQVWAPLAMAAVLTIAVVGGWRWANQPQYMWQVTDVKEPTGVAMADGEAVMGAMPRSGPIRTAPGSEIELQLSQELRFRLLGDGAIDLPAPARRWPAREMVLTVNRGEVFGTTAGEALDRPLRVITPEAEARVIGTTFAVFQDSAGTCVCLWKGTVEVTRRDEGSMVSLPSESKYYVYADGTTSGFLPLDGMEQMKLQMLAEAGLLPVVGKD